MGGNVGGAVGGNVGGAFGGNVAIQSSSNFIANRF